MKLQEILAYLDEDIRWCVRQQQLTNQASKANWIELLAALEEAKDTIEHGLQTTGVGWIYGLE